ncbi:MAG TPA: GNAT family N-acetyltransferase [Gemmatimonadales bacterium]|jgi:predicted GNAT family acetyltransferase|nr:GNAT family N-acetyltransferase [Gemmatimonadales bacterium]
MSATHDPLRHRFVIATPHGDAELVYRPRADGTLDLQHTFVPVEARGGTLASELVEAAVAHARAGDLRLIATCPYVRRWRERHPEAADRFVAP